MVQVGAKLKISASVSRLHSGTGFSLNIVCMLKVHSIENKTVLKTSHTFHIKWKELFKNILYYYNMLWIMGDKTAYVLETSVLDSRMVWWLVCFNDMCSCSAFLLHPEWWKDNSLPDLFMFTLSTRFQLHWRIGIKKGAYLTFSAERIVLASVFCKSLHIFESSGDLVKEKILVH